MCRLPAPVLPFLRQGLVGLQGVQAACELPEFGGAFFAEFDAGQALQPLFGGGVGAGLGRRGGGLRGDVLQ